MNKVSYRFDHSISSVIFQRSILAALRRLQVSLGPVTCVTGMGHGPQTGRSGRPQGPPNPTIPFSPSRRRRHRHFAPPRRLLRRPPSTGDKDSDDAVGGVEASPPRPPPLPFNLGCHRRLQIRLPARARSPRYLPFPSLSRVLLPDR